MAKTKKALEEILAGTDAVAKREALSKALDPGTPEFRVYRAHEELNLEHDLKQHLGLFKEHKLAMDDLRKIRRGVMRRYAWGLGWQLTLELKGEGRATRFRCGDAGLCLLASNNEGRAGRMQKPFRRGPIGSCN